MNNCCCDNIPSYSELDKLVLEECGYSIDYGKGQEIYENVIAENTKDKIFVFTDVDSDSLKQSFGIEDVIDMITNNQAFSSYWNKHILSNLDSNNDYLLLEQCDNSSFIYEKLFEKLNDLKKLEILYYVDFFRSILDIAENEQLDNLIDINDEAFNKMPNVMRLY